MSVSIIYYTQTSCLGDICAFMQSNQIRISVAITIVLYIMFMGSTLHVDLH
jgi:low affinity Fe/Cu permease